jgi:tetratricopeptide (TPR) repeat protein
MASEYDPGLLPPTESDDDTPTLPLFVREEPEPPPRWQPPRLPRFHGSDLWLLRYGPWILGSAGVVALVLAALTATESWGTIATRAGITLVVAGICCGLLIWLFHRIHQRWTRRRWFILAASLIALGMLGTALAPALHAAQARALENQGNYQRAIDEYALSGEHSPDGQDIGRSYLEWGRVNLLDQDAQMAVQHLEAAAETYSATTAARQARAPLGQALLAWGQQLMVEQQYGAAIQQFAHLRTRYADTQAAQQAQLGQNEPEAYYEWGQQLQANQQFQDALAKFQTLSKLFPNSTYAAQAYNAAASDLYAWGQALVKQASYAKAIAVYQQAINHYPDAPAAKQAQQALNAPQKVTGRLIFASGPPDAKVIIRLSSSWSTNANGYVQGGYVYEAKTDANGNFTFTDVALGRYLVDWQQGAAFTTLLHQGTNNPVYIADVEPLRATDMGDIQVEQS